MENQFGLKELYDVALKATYSMEIGDRTIDTNEVIAVFDKIQVANLNESKKFITAHGGFDDRDLVFWNTTEELKLNFSQGIFSKTQLSLMTNAKLVNNQANSGLDIHYREYLESNENGVISLKYAASSPIFVYNANTGAKLTYTAQDNKHLVISSTYCDVVVDYTYNYQKSSTTLLIGRDLTNGFLSLEGKTRVKDDITGHTKTGIIKIPKLKLMSDLSIRLGKNADPIVGKFEAIAIPTGVRGAQSVMTLTILEDDIDSDL